MELDLDTVSAELEQKFHFRFKDKDLLYKALSHKSQANERRRKEDSVFERIHNERLEFLGDAVLQLVISDILWDRFREATEGKLSKMRSALVNEISLAEVARDIDLGVHILLGKGELNSGGRNKNSILSSSYEALLGALYVEGGLAAAYKTIERHFGRRLADIDVHAFARDYKSVLQERVQGEFRRSPVYKIQKEDGPDHRKTFDVIVSVGRLMAAGQGGSKKAAEQSAAKALLTLLDKLDNSDDTNDSDRPDV